LNLANHFLATTVGFKNLREKSPEGVFLAEQPAPTESAIQPILQRLGRYEMAETIAKLTDRLLTNPGLLVGQFLSGGPRSAAQCSEVKTGEI
jgi:hypothetical protein